MSRCVRSHSHFAQAGALFYRPRTVRLWLLVVRDSFRICVFDRRVVLVASATAPGGKENFVRSYSAWAEAEGADCRRGTYLSFVGWNSVMPSWFLQTPSRRCSLNLFFSSAVWSRRSISNLFLLPFWVRAAIYVPFSSLGWLWSFCGSSLKLSFIQFPKGQSQRTRESATRQTIPRERLY